MIIDNTEIKVLEKIKEALNIIASDFSEEHNKINIIRNKGLLMQIYVIIKLLIFISGIISFLLLFIPNSIETETKEVVKKHFNISLSEETHTKNQDFLNILTLWEPWFKNNDINLTFSDLYNPFNDDVLWEKEEKLSSYFWFIDKELFNNLNRITNINFNGYTSRNLIALTGSALKLCKTCGLYQWKEYYKWYKWEWIFTFRIWRENWYSEFNIISDILIVCPSDYQYCEMIDIEWLSYKDNNNYWKIKYMMCNKDCEIWNNWEEKCTFKNKQTYNLSCN